MNPFSTIRRYLEKSKKAFTPEQVELLKSSRHVLGATEKSVTFINEMKERRIEFTDYRIDMFSRPTTLPTVVNRENYLVGLAYEVIEQVY